MATSPLAADLPRPEDGDEGPSAPPEVEGSFSLPGGVVSRKKSQKRKDKGKERKSEAQQKLDDEAVEHMLQYANDDDFLTIPKDESDSYDYELRVLQDLITQTYKLHPARNSNPQANEAFLRVIFAGLERHVDAANLQALRDWDGMVGRGETLNNGHWEPLDISPIYKVIYNKAVPALTEYLKVDTNQVEYRDQLDAVNTEIEGENNKFSLPPRTGFIDYHTLDAHVVSLRSTNDGLARNPGDERGRAAYKNGVAMLKTLIESKGYPDAFFPSEWNDILMEDATPVPRPGQSAVGQPTVGQPAVGQPTVGQPAVGQPGQPPFGQPGQPPFGQPGQPPFGQPAVGQPTVGQPPFGQPTVGQPAVGQPAQPPFGQPGQPTVGQPAVGQPTVGQPAVGQPTVGQPAVGQPPFGQPAQPIPGQPGFGQPGQPTSGQPPSGQLGQPMPGQPAFGQPGQTIPGEQPSSEQPGACLLEARKIQLETTNWWAHMNWKTHRTIDGDIILCYKALSKRGREPHGYEYTLMTQASPYFRIVLGSELDGRDTETYLKLPNIYRIKTDKGDPLTPQYTWRDISKYDRVLFVASKPRKSATSGRTPMAAETQCAVIWTDNTIRVMSSSQLKSSCPGKVDNIIAEYCKTLQVPTPREMGPKTVIVDATSAAGRALLDAGKRGESPAFWNQAVPGPQPVPGQQPAFWGSTPGQQPVAGPTAPAVDQSALIQHAVAPMMDAIQRIDNRLVAAETGVVSAVRVLEEMMRRLGLQNPS